MTMKCVALMSSGIDSPVAVWLMLEQGVEVVALHLDNRPYADNHSIEKFKRLVDQLEEQSGRSIKTVIAPHGNTQKAIAGCCNRRYQCLLCKRMMYRVAEQVALQENADFIVTGESMGQVASQTLQNLSVLNQAIKTPVIRPLIGFDKGETINIARGIGSFEISTEQGVCCTAVPKKPSTAAKLETILDEEKKIGVEELVEDALSGLTSSSNRI